MLRAFGRTFLVQASFNYDRLLGIGMAFASLPILRSLEDAGENGRYHDAVARAAEHFNAHPYLTPLAVGALARAELDGVPPEQLRRLRAALSGPLGSVGDRLIWSGVLPTASALGLVLLVMVSPWAGMAAFLGVYNLVHIGLRGWGLGAGWRSGMQVSHELTAQPLQRTLGLTQRGAPLAVGLALPVVVAFLFRSFGGGLSFEGAPLYLSAVGVALVGVVLARRVWPGFAGIRFGLIVVLLALATGWL